MNTSELEMRKTQLARKILNERDENIIIFLRKNLRKIKRTAIDTREREKLVNEFFQFVEGNSIADYSFEFNREDCYDRQIFLR